MTNLDILQTAHRLLNRYGAAAMSIATKRAEALLDQGDRDGCWAWIQIAKTIAELQRGPAHESYAVH